MLSFLIFFLALTTNDGANTSAEMFLSLTFSRHSSKQRLPVDLVRMIVVVWMCPFGDDGRMCGAEGDFPLWDREFQEKVQNAIVAGSSERMITFPVPADGKCESYEFHTERSTLNDDISVAFRCNPERHLSRYLSFDLVMINRDARKENRVSGALVPVGGLRFYLTFSRHVVQTDDEIRTLRATLDSLPIQKLSLRWRDEGYKVTNIWRFRHAFEVALNNPRVVVELHGLESRADWNGKRVEIRGKRQVKTMVVRWPVRVEGENKTVLITEANLRFEGHTS